MCPGSSIRQNILGNVEWYALISVTVMLHEGAVQRCDGVDVWSHSSIADSGEQLSHTKMALHLKEKYMLNLSNFG